MRRKAVSPRKGLSGGKAHDSKDYITKMTTCAPGGKGKKFWEDALRLFFCGDQELIDYVQMVVGMENGTALCISSRPGFHP